MKTKTVGGDNFVSNEATYSTEAPHFTETLDVVARIITYLSQQRLADIWITWRKDGVDAY